MSDGIVKVILACDESGAKGYADQREQYAGEVGVFAGILVPEQLLATTEIALEAAIAPYRGKTDKLHIADLPADDKPILRARVYETIGQLQLTCFWYAIHVEGYHRHFQQMNEMIARSFGQIVPETAAPVLSRDEKHSLHAELFRGLYSHLVCFIEENAPGEIEIEVRTDHVERPIAKYFRRVAEHLLNFEPRIEVISGYDRTNQRVVKRTLRFQSIWPDGLRPSTKVTSLEIKRVSNADPVVVAADVLANGLNYHFRTRAEATRYADLNRPNALIGHPLAERFDVFRNWGGPDICDQLFRHPNRQPASD